MNVTPSLRQYLLSILFICGGTWIASAAVCGTSNGAWVAGLAMPFTLFALFALHGSRVDPAHDPASTAAVLAVEDDRATDSEVAPADSARARAALLSEMSHELRTPMNGVLGMAELLAETQLTPEQNEYLDALRRSGENLLDVITDTLDLSKIEAGELRIEPTPFDPRALVEECARNSAADADRRGLELAVRCAPDVPRRVIGDSGRIRQVLINLCNNALKFTPRGSVVLEATRDVATSGAACIAFSVTDTGIGIAADAVERVFDRRSHDDASLTGRVGGTGRGLTISRALARSMQGDLHVESRLGQGSRFVLRLPLAADDLPSGSARPRLDLGRRRALVVDDLEVNRRALSESLEAIGARCDTAGSEEEALEIVRERAAAGDPIALAFIDVEMPDTTGTVLCRMIKGELERASPRFVLLAPEVHRARTRSWQLAGFEACLQKPLRRAELEDCLLELLAPTSAAPTEKARLHATGSHGRGPKELLGLNVLVVEDNLVNQRVAERMLEKLGCNVAIADNGEEALARCDQAAFDLVLMDCQMPVRDGFSATEEWRRRERTRGAARIPILALTANALKADRDRCLASGMDDYLAKPIVREELVGALLRWRPKACQPSPTLDSVGAALPSPGSTPASVGSTRPAVGSTLP